MDTFIAQHNDNSLLRSHPWTSMHGDQSCIYIDFKQHPARIRDSLEDLLPFKKWAFVESFYSLIEWINGPQSLLESNDCSFNDVQDNDDAHYPYAKKSSARLMILYRDIAENCQQRSIDWLMQQILQSLASSKRGFRAGAIGLSQNATCYLALGDTPDTGGMGQQLAIHFFAYGKNQRRCYENLQLVLQQAHSCLTKVNKQLQHGELERIYR